MAGARARSGRVIVAVLTAGAIAWAALAGAPVAGAEEPGPRIIGGNEADPSAYPFMVGLLRHAEPDAFNAQYCGGVLVSRWWVLTAAHCAGSYGEPVDAFRPASASSIDLLLGTNDLSGPDGTRVRAAEVRVHPDAAWIGTLSTGFVPGTDLALVRLRVPSSIVPVHVGLPAGGAFAGGDPADIVGWGTTVDSTDPNQQFFLSQLQRATVPVVSTSSCQASWGAVITSAAFVCAGAPGHGTSGTGVCFGDSGGPLLVHVGGDASTWYQVGIASFVGASSCASTGVPAVFTRVAEGPLLAWVKANSTFGPHGDAASLVRDLWRSFSGRAPTSEELHRWTGQLTGVGAVDDLTADFARSSAADRRVGAIDRVYRTGLGRPVDSEGVRYWADRYDQGTALSSIAAFVVRSAEFQATYGSLGDRAFVAQLYRNVLGREGDAEGLDFWTALLDQGATRARVVLGFSESNEHVTSTRADVRLTIAFHGMIDRAPNADERSTWGAKSLEQTAAYLFGTNAYALRW